MAACPYCGKSNSDSQSNCVYCGQSLGGDSDANHRTPNSANDYLDDFHADTVPSPPPAPTPRKKSKLPLYIGGGVLGIAAVLGVVFLILTMINPVRTIASAVNKTMDAFVAQMGSVESLREYGAAVMEAQRSDRTKDEFNLTIGIPESDAIYLRFSGLTDYKTHTGSGELSIGVENGGSFGIPVSVDDSGVSLAVPQLFDDTLFFVDSDYISQLLAEALGTPMETEYLDIFSHAQAATEELAKAQEELFNAVVRLFATVESEEQEPYSVGNHQWTPHLLVYPEEAQDALVSSYKNYLTILGTQLPEITIAAINEEFGSWDQFMDDLVTESMWLLNEATVCIDERGYLVAYSYRNAKDVTCRFALEGDENPWESYCFYEDEEKVVWGETANTNGAFYITLTDGADTLRLSYTDSTGEFSLVFEDFITFSGHFKENDGLAEFRFSVEDDFLAVGMTYRMGATTESCTPLTGSTVYDLTEMTEADAEALSAEALMALFTDPELYGLIEDIAAIFSFLDL